MVSKRKINLVLSFLIIVMLGLFSYILNKPYAVKNGKIIAAEIPALTKDNVDEIISYFRENEINTAILNSGTASKNSIKKLSRNKIQSLIKISENDNSKEIVKSFKPYGIIVNDNFYYDNIDKCAVFLETDNTMYADIYDGYIVKNISANQYELLKSLTDKPVLLNYSDENMWNDIFYLSNYSVVDGAVVATCSDGLKPIATELFYKNENLPVFNFNVSDKFTVTYPTSDVTTYYSGIFITGTGSKNGQVYINGERYDSRSDGTFGIYYSLEKGENEISISQDDIEYRFKVNRKTYSSSNSNYELSWDDTVELEKGSVVRTYSENLTSLLSDKDDDSRIVEGLTADIPLVVYESEETERNGKKTWAYKLQNGMYVLASKVELSDFVTDIFEGDTKDKELYNKTRITNVSTENVGTDEIITFHTSGKSAVISNLENDSLQLTFLNTDTAEISIPISDFFKNYKIFSDDDGTHVVFNLEPQNKLWGYKVEISDNFVSLYLKSAPQIFGGKNILSGITVMIDAGHGGYDSGAMGVASGNGPVEKELNLATAQALKSILEQNGATVLMTRDDDSFLSLEERRGKIDSLKPDIFVAVHHNSMDYSYNSENAFGCEAYYFTDISKNLADEMCKSVSDSTGRVNRGAQSGYYYVTRTNICPAVLMEYSFIINSNEYSKTYTDEYIYKSAFGSFKAILKIVENKNEI